MDFESKQYQLYRLGPIDFQNSLSRNMEVVVSNAAKVLSTASYD